ncbi:MAG: hypothetical protein QOH05_1333 [Acetobacteraceae bacterium]|jgi:CRP-like cAMP-binding protein|nr:hypothetical protein [Acetobacteraceae bacterium]
MLPPHGRPIAKVNALLAGLEAEDRALLAAMIRVEHPPLNHILSSRAEPVTEIWFPHDGVVALSVTDNEGRTVQVGVIGAEGCVGLENIFQHTPAMADAWVQIAGAMSVIAASQLRPALEARPAIQAALTRFLYELSTQSLQTVACNRLHSLKARCCRWLLMMQDRTEGDELPLTQENLATMLGSGRPRINVLLGALEQDGLVRRYRGRIRLLTRAGIEGRACECYRQLSHK